jgi:hypothetical protein
MTNHIADNSQHKAAKVAGIMFLPIGGGMKTSFDHDTGGSELLADKLAPGLPDAADIAELKECLKSING